MAGSEGSEGQSESETIRQLCETIREMNVTISHLTEQNIELVRALTSRHDEDEDANPYGTLS